LTRPSIPRRKQKTIGRNPDIVVVKTSKRDKNGVKNRRYVRKKLGIILTVAALVLTGAGIWQTKGPPEPTWDGRPESAWLEDIQNWTGDTNAPAFLAFRNMGSKALPELMAIAQAKRSFLQTAISRLLKNRENLNAFAAASVKYTCVAPSSLSRSWFV
jgi:hypothetical protein